MKRTGCFLLSVLILLLVTVTVVGAQEPPLVLSATNASGEVGETVTVAVNITGNPGVTSLKLSLSYDTTALKLIESENQDLFDGWYQASPTTDTLPYLMVWVSSNAQTANGTLVLLKFQIADGVKVGTVLSPVLTVEEAYSNGETVTANAVSFNIEVTCEHTYGPYTKVDGSTHSHECTKCQTVETLDHTWDAGTVTKPATHLEVGSKKHTCTACGETKTVELPKTTAHEYGAWEKYDADKHKQTCSCGDVNYETHTWDAGTVTKPATHLAVGSKQHTCTACGETKTVELPKTTAHEYGAWEKYDADKHKQTCPCGDVNYQTHTWDAGIVTKPATHLEVGSKKHTCTACGEMKTVELPKTTAHEYGAWEKYDADKHKQTCPCGDVNYETHIWNEGEETVPATEEEEGTKTFTCTACGSTKTEAIPKLEKTPSNGWVLPVIIGAVLVLIAAGVLVYVFVIKGKQKPASAKTVEKPKTEAPKPSIPEKPKTEAPKPSVPEKPKTEAPKPSVPEKPKTEAPKPSVPEKPKTEAPKPSIPEKPKAEAPKPTVLEKPKTEAPKPSIPEKPKTEAPKPSVSEKPKAEAPKPSIPEKPKTEAPKPSIPEKPKTEAPKPSVPEKPKAEAPKPTVLEKPKTEAPKPSIPEKPKTEAPKPSISEKPKTEALKPSVPEKPKTEAPKPSIPEKPKAEAPKPSIPEKPKTEAPKPDNQENSKAETPKTSSQEELKK